MKLGGIRQIGKEIVFLASTTYGTETSGITTFMATIDVFQQNDKIRHNHNIGNRLHFLSRKIIAEKELESGFDKFLVEPVIKPAFRKYL